jgi:transposase
VDVKVAEGEAGGVDNRDDPLSGHRCLVRSREGDRLKILCFGADGYGLWSQAADAGSFHTGRDRTEAGSVQLRHSELTMAPRGIDLQSVRRSKRYRRKTDS